MGPSSESGNHRWHSLTMKLVVDTRRSKSKARAEWVQKVATCPHPAYSLLSHVSTFSLSRVDDGGMNKLTVRPWNFGGQWPAFDTAICHCSCVWTKTSIAATLRANERCNHQSLTTGASTASATEHWTLAGCPLSFMYAYFIPPFTCVHSLTTLLSSFLLHSNISLIFFALWKIRLMFGYKVQEENLIHALSMIDASGTISLFSTARCCSYFFQFSSAV